MRIARLVATIGVAGALLSRPVHAQGPTPLQKADALFNAGRALLDAGEYADACPKFAEANTLAPGLGVTLYLADCYERLGKTASALVEFRHAVALAKQRNDKRQAVAAARATALLPRVPKLIIEVSPEAKAQGVQITKDGVPLPPTQWGVSSDIDPGDHVLDIAAEGKAPRHVVVHLAADERTRTESVGPLDNPPAAPVAAAPAVPATPKVGVADDRTFIIASIASAGAGVVGIAIGAGLGVAAKSKLTDSNADCDAQNQCTPAGLSARASAEHLANGATAAFVIGGAAITAGAVLFLVRPKSGTASASLRVSPDIARSGGGVTFGGAF